MLNYMYSSQSVFRILLVLPKKNSESGWLDRTTKKLLTCEDLRAKER
jgi:hypothetical protein